MVFPNTDRFLSVVVFSYYFFQISIWYFIYEILIKSNCDFIGYLCPYISKPNYP